jgi:amphi-Trp domain-containing protein
MAQEEKFFFESIQDPRSLRDYLQSLMDGLEKGRIVLSTGGDELTLTPPDLLKLTLKAKRKAPTSKLVLKLSWKDEPKAAIRSEDAMSIRS